MNSKFKYSVQRKVIFIDKTNQNINKIEETKQKQRNNNLMSNNSKMFVKSKIFNKKKEENITKQKASRK